MFWEAPRLMGATPFIWRQSRYNKEITFDMEQYLCKKNIVGKILNFIFVLELFGIIGRM